MIALHTNDTRRDLALSRASLHGLASLCFCRPDAEWEQRWRSLASCMGRILCASPEAHAAGGALGETLASLLGCRTSLRELQSEHARVLGDSPRAGAMPYETEWPDPAGDGLQLHRLEDITAFYEAFGMDPRSIHGERADHVSIELEFLRFLCLKEAWAEDRGLADLAAVCREMERVFLKDHLARWAGDFGERAQALGRGGFHGTAARFLGAWIEDERRRLDAQPTEAFVERVLVPRSGALAAEAQSFPGR